MVPSLEWLLAAHAGVVTRHDLIDAFGADGAQRASRHLLRVLPATYVDPRPSDDETLPERVALRWAGDAALSHLSALRRWGLPVPESPDVHLTTGGGRHLRSVRGVTIHRPSGFDPSGPEVVRRDGLPVVRLEQALVESWPLLRGAAQRAPAIVAVQRRLTTAARIATAAAAMPKLRGRRELLALLDLLAQGRHSELELWGHRHVFDCPALPPASPQLRVPVGGRTYYLDNPYPRELVDVELDGAEHHGPERREADLRRDAALATLGWLTIRFSGARLHADPEGCRQQVLAALEARRRFQYDAEPY